MKRSHFADLLLNIWLAATLIHYEAPGWVFTVMLVLMAILSLLAMWIEKKLADKEASI